MTTTQLSRAAFDRLQAEFDDLTTRGRIEVAQKIETARLLGDLSENGDYHAAKDEQGHMEGRIRQLEHILETAEIIEGGDEGIVSAGSIVTIVYEGDDDAMAERYLVGHMEEKVGDLDVISPRVAARRGPARRERRHVGRVRGTDRQAARASAQGGDRLVASRATQAGHPTCRPVRAMLPARSRHDVRSHARRSDRRADRGAAARLDGDRRPQLVHVLRAARRALPRRRPRPPRPRPRHPIAARRSAWRTAPTTPSPSATCSASSSSSPSATRWAGRSPS